MRILYICRSFSGFEVSLESGVWEPTGAPTIYKIINTLDQSEHELDLVFTGAGRVGREFIELKGLSSKVRLLPDYRAFYYAGRMAPMWATIYNGFKLYQFWKKTKPDLVYVDRANLITGAMLARLGARVILRVMGIYPDMWSLKSINRPSAWLQRYSYKAPFAHVICTQDGTAGEKWMDDYLSSSTPRTLMVNGVDMASGDYDLPDINLQVHKDFGKSIVLFVGRLEKIKGCEEFVKAAIKVAESKPGKFHFVIVGTGSLKDTLYKVVAESDQQEDITFIERIPHSQIAGVHRLADIYVSLNKLGNLSNANLEVMRSGQCMIIPDSDMETGADISTDTLVPRDAVYRINRNNMVDELISAIVELGSDLKKRETLKSNIAVASKAFISSWQQRIDKEVQLFEQVASGA